MVLLAAAICTKPGKVIISRQFVEMTRARIEGLLSAFPKLLGGSGKQHTFVETESVRYVYQPLDKLYMLLITTKASNILEDLETLRLFSRIIPEYCKNMDEADIISNSFNLIFAFDEIVALGYREQVNLAQIRTFVEMDSHEEKVYQAVRMTQEREAKQKMKVRAKELDKAKQEASRKGGRATYGTGFGSSSSMSSFPNPTIGDSVTSTPEVNNKPATFSAPISRQTGPSRALKLGSKNKDVESFVDQLKSEGETVSTAKQQAKSLAKSSVPAAATESVHISMQEKITLTALRDGGLQNMETSGLVTLQITDEKYGKIKIQMENRDQKGIQLQQHPHVDKELFRNKCLIALKNPDKPFPLNIDIGIIKWRFQTQEDMHMPLSINCWPTENQSGGCDVNIEYELEQVLELNDVVISIPILHGGQPPVVASCDGDYSYENRKNTLEWRLALIDSSNKNGAMEFSAHGKPCDYFPITVSFVSKNLFCNLRVVDVLELDQDTPVKHSVATILETDSYEVV